MPNYAALRTEKIIEWYERLRSDADRTPDDEKLLFELGKRLPADYPIGDSEEIAA